MVEYKHNEPYYKLQLSELGENLLKVISFHGEERISQPFEFHFELLSDDPAIEASDVLDKKATFIMTRGENEPLEINGIICFFEQRGRTPDYVSYHAVLVPKLWRLGLTYQSEIYQQMNIKDVLAAIMKSSGLNSNDYKIDVKANYQVVEYMVQYRETNLNFLNRRLEHYGIHYYFEHNGNNDIIVFSDNNKNLPVIDSSNTVPYNPNGDPLSKTETINELVYQEKVTTGLVRLKDYNYMFPNKQLSVESRINNTAPGMYYEYGDNFPDENEGKWLARVRNEEIISQSVCFKGISDSRLFRAGHKFIMEQHYREDWNDEFVITKVSHCGTQRGLFHFIPKILKVQPTYENKFEAIPWDIEYRPPRVTPIPKIPGIMSAKVESASNDEYAFVDDNGRYRVKMLFDLTERKNGEASLPIRLSQPYAGSDYGMHFPNHAENEMIWACVDGNVDRPIGLGTLPNPKQSSPVKANNKTQNIVRTAAGNEIVMDDRKEEARISVTTPDKHNLIMDDKEDKIQMTTTEKHTLLMDDKNKNITIQTKDGHLVILNDDKTNITIKSKNGHVVCISDENGKENITMMDKDKKNKFVIDISNQKLVIATDEGSIDLHAPKGVIEIKAKEFKMETTGDTSFKAANIESEADSNYKVKATNFTAEASADYKQKGQNITSEAAMDHKSKGMNISAEASVENKIKGLNVAVEASVKNDVKGTMLNLQASGINTIQGSLVKIN